MQVLFRLGLSQLVNQLKKKTRKKDLAVSFVCQILFVTEEAVGGHNFAAGQYNGLPRGNDPQLRGRRRGEIKTSVEVKPHCYLNSREIRLPRTPARREA
jgi:hypothetical protein